MLKKLEKAVPYLVCLIIAVLFFLLWYNWNPERSENRTEKNDPVISQNPKWPVTMQNPKEPVDPSVGTSSPAEQVWISGKITKFEASSLSMVENGTRKTRTFQYSDNVKFETYDVDPEGNIVTKPTTKSAFKPGKLISILAEGEKVIVMRDGGESYHPGHE